MPGDKLYLSFLECQYTKSCICGWKKSKAKRTTLVVRFGGWLYVTFFFFSLKQVSYQFLY